MRGPIQRFGRRCAEMRDFLAPAFGSPHRVGWVAGLAFVFPVARDAFRDLSIRFLAIESISSNAGAWRSAKRPGDYQGTANGMPTDRPVCQTSKVFQSTRTSKL
jgi:hypothetical protein